MQSPINNRHGALVAGGDILSMLIRCASDGSLPAVLYLCDLDGDPFQSDASDGRTAVIAAAQNGHADILAVFCLHAKCEEKRDVGLQVRDKQGLTALHWAVIQNQVQALSVLLFFMPESALDKELQEHLHSANAHVARFIHNHYSLHLAITSDDSSSRVKKMRQHQQQAVSFSSLDKRLKALVAWCCQKGCLEVMMQRIAPWICFVSIAVAFFFSLVYAFEPAMWGTSHRSTRMVLLQVLNFTAQCAIWLLIAKTRSTDPGSAIYPELSYLDALQNIIVAGNAGEANSKAFCCHMCRIWKLPRTSHSRVTDRCVPVFDHYCVFLQADIGRDNHSSFLSALAVMALATMPLFIIITVVYVQVSYKGLLDSPVSTWWRKSLDVFLMWTCMVWLQMFFFLLFQLFAFCKGKTAREINKHGSAWSSNDDTRDTILMCEDRATFRFWCNKLASLLFLFSSGRKEKANEEETSKTPDV